MLFKQVIVWLQLLLLLRIASCSAMTVTAVNPTVSTVTDYEFSILNTDMLDVPLGSVIVISFPADYVSLLTGGLYNCSYSSWFQSVTLSCSISGLVMTVSGGFPVDRLAIGQLDNYTFVVYNITNPPYAIYTDVFNGQFDSAGTQLITMQSNGGSGILLQAGSMTCSLSVSPSVVSNKAILTVTVSPSHPIPIDGQLILTTNSYWLRDSRNVIKIFDTTVQCSGSTGAAGNLGCSLYDDVVSAIQTITVTHLIPVAGTTGFTFTASPFNNPPTTEPQGGFSLTTQSSTGKTIDMCSGAKLATVTSGQLASPSFSMSSSLVGSSGQATISFKLSTAVIITDSVTITFPAELSLSVSSILLTNGNRAVTSYSVTGQTLTFVIGTGTQTYQSNVVLTFIITNITNPPSTATTGSFSIATSRFNYNIDTLTSSLTYAATSGVLLASLTATVLEIGAPSVYTLLITFTHPITATGYLYVTFPSVFSALTSGSYTCSSNASITTACSYSSSNKVMTITSFSSSSVSAGMVISISINGITNPISVGSFQSLSLSSTYSGTSDTVDTLSSGLSLTLVTRVLPSSRVTLTSTASTVYTLTTFTLTINNQNPLPVGSLLYIVVPTDISYAGSYSCMLGSLGVSCGNSTIDSQPCIMVSLGNGAVIATGALASSPIAISNVYTPASTKQTSTFLLYLVYADGTRSEQLSSGLLYNAINPSTFSPLKVTASSIQNYYSPTSFVISVKTGFQIANDTRLKVTFPSVMSATSACSAVSSWLQTPSCSNSSNIVTVQLQFSIPNVKGFDLSLDSIKNYPSLVSYSVKVTLTSSDGVYQISQDSYYLQNSLPNVITITSWSFSSTVLKDSSSLSINLTPTVPLGSTDYLLVTFPSEFTLTSPSCTLSSQLSCTSPTTSTIKVVTSGVFPSTIVVTIAGITNPSVSPSSAIFIETYSSAGSLYDQDYSIKFVRGCSAYCRTCLTTNTSSCLSCYTNTTLASGNTILSGTTCTSGCPSGNYYNSTTASCALCSTNCTQCITYSGCTSCPPTYFLNNLLCVSGCPLGYYMDTVTQSCVVCTTALHCETCSSSLYCSSCVNGFLLYGKYCLTNCPALITTEDTFNRVCQPCPTNCTQCTGTTFVTCIKCAAGYLLDQGGCYLTCQTQGTVPSSDGLTCTSCSITCLTCSGTQYNCLSCNTSSSNKYLYGGNCLGSCGAGYYGDNTLFTCVRCNDPCDTCLNASTTSCLSCLTGKYLYNTTCTATCPIEYFQNGSICSACQGPCKQCTSPTICTSCVTGKLLYQGNCGTSCPVNTVDQGGVCVNCSTNCKTCQATASLCASCYATNYLLNGVCYQNCPLNYYPNDTTTLCQRCVSPCQTCSNSTVCITCVTSYNLDGSSCISGCPTGKIAVSQVCTACNSQCLTCVGTINACTSCQPGLLYNQDLSTCTASCQAGYYKLASTSTCVLMCPTLYYTGTTDCMDCPALCTACTSSSVCTACETGNYFYSSMCYAACPLLAPYSSSDGRSCVTCSISNCLTCSAALCLTCMSGHLNILKTSCIAGCPTNQTYNSTSQTCEVIVIPPTPTPNNTNTTNTTNSTNTTDIGTTQVKLTFVPLPYMIGTVVLVAIIFVGKFQFEKMRTVNSVLPFVSCLCYFAAVTNGVVAVLSTSPITFSLDLYLLMAGVGITLLLNIVNQIIVCSDLRRDPAYQDFLPSHYCGVGTIMILAIISPFKWLQLLWSNCFGFDVFSLLLSQQSFINKFYGLQWASLLASLSYIGSGCIVALQASYSKYTFYGSVQIVVLSLLEICLTIASNRSAAQPYELRYKETASQQLQQQGKVENIDSHNEIYSENNVKDVSHQALNSNHLNIFDVIGPQALEDAKVEEKRAQTASAVKQNTEAASSDKGDQIQYQSALEYNRKDPLRVEKKHIEKALEEGVFRHNAKSILEIKRREEDQSALADAVKLYHLQMRRKAEAEQLNHRQIRGNEPMAQVQQPPERASQEQPVQVQQIKLQEDEEPEEIDLNQSPALQEQLQMIIFDDGEELKSVPTHVSKDPTNSKKRLNSLGSLALIIEEDAQQLEQINLDSDRKKEGGVQKAQQPTELRANPPQQNSSKLSSPKQPKESAVDPPGKKSKPVKKQRQNKDALLKKVLEPAETAEATKIDSKALKQEPARQTPKLDVKDPRQQAENSQASISLAEDNSEQDLIPKHQPDVDILYDAGEQAGEILNSSRPKQAEQPAPQSTQQKGRKTPQYDNTMENQEIPSPTISKPKERNQAVAIKEEPVPREVVQPKHPSRQIPDSQSIQLVDESSHGDMIQGYREEEYDNLDSETGSAKKLVPVTSLEQQKANLKSKLIVSKSPFEQPEIPIIVQRGYSPRKRDDLQSIYTVEDADYQDTRRVQQMPMARRTGNFPQERRYLEEEVDEQLVKPSQLFRGGRPPRQVRRPDNLSVGGEPSLLRPNNDSKLQILRKKH